MQMLSALKRPFQRSTIRPEERHLLLSQNDDASAVGFAVGYGSPSQLSREYHRLFGASPQQDVDRLRATREDVATAM